MRLYSPPFSNRPSTNFGRLKYILMSPFSPFDGPLTRQTAAYNRPTTTAEAPKVRSFSPASTRSRSKVEWPKVIT